MRDGEAEGDALLDEREPDRVLEGVEGAEERMLTAGKLEHKPLQLRTTTDTALNVPNT